MVVRALANLSRRFLRTDLDDVSWLPPQETHTPRQSELDAVERANRRRMGRASGASVEVPEAMCVWLGRRPGRQRSSAIVGLLVMLIGGGALVAGVLFWQNVSGFAGGVCGLFGVIFVLAGLYRVLSAFNPILNLRTDRDTFAPGDVFTVWWTFSRPPARARSLVVKLVGEERATYQQGSSTSTATDAFHEEELLQIDAPVPLTGSFEVRLPADATHSFRARRNVVAWVLRAHAPIGNWPDIHRGVDLRVWSGPEPQPGREVVA